MLRHRLMPCLLLRGWGLVKTVRFKNPAYVGDPINTVRIYNEKEVDELIFLDITATPEGKQPPYELLEDLASECFMPLAYGGGIHDLDAMGRIFSLGVEKIAINTYAHENPDFLTQGANRFGSQSIIASIDAKKTLMGGYKVFVNGGRKKTKHSPAEWAKTLESAGAGEILITSIDRDGTFSGYDVELVSMVTEAVSVPVIACGGCGTVDDFGTVIREGGASAAAAGSMVVYQGSHRAVLINFPLLAERKRVLNQP